MREGFEPECFVCEGPEEVLVRRLVSVTGKPRTRGGAGRPAGSRRPPGPVRQAAGPACRQVVQGVPLRTNDDGGAESPVWVAWNPMLTLAPAGTVPL